MKSRQGIFRAMADLLQEKEFSQITVTDLLRLSGVSRSTFYAHFRSKEEVIQGLCDEMFHHVLSPDLKKEHGHDFSHYPVFDYRHLLTHFLFHVQEDKDLIYAIVSSGASQVFRLALRESLSPIMNACVESHAIENPSIDSSLHAKILTETFLVILDDWILSGCIKSPDEVCGVFFAFSKTSK